jgi:hypothetical protein
MMQGMRFVIDGLPRTGSTSLARMLACHADISCLVEPFHPARYGGQYRKLVKDAHSLRNMLDLIWLRWGGIKHVWEVPHFWPFAAQPSLNEELVLYAPAVISIQRRNLLQRHVSSMISRKLQFWIGTKAEFLERLEQNGLPELDADNIRDAIDKERLEVERRRELLSRLHAKALFVDYEDLFDERIGGAGQMAQTNAILGFLGYTPLRAVDCSTQEWKEATDPSVSKWNTRDVYDRIPGIRTIEEKVGSDETGWLFH